jgi:hypothetical protein
MSGIIAFNLSKKEATSSIIIQGKIAHGPEPEVMVQDDEDEGLCREAELNRPEWSVKIE